LLTEELIRKRLITEESFSRPLNRRFIERLTKGHNCFSRDIYIAADLTVYPCVMERRIAHGNLRGKHLRDILDPEIMGFDKNMVEGCNVCEFKYACFDCRPDSITESITAQPWYCTYDPNTGQFADVDAFIAQIMSTQEAK